MNPLLEVMMTAALAAGRAAQQIYRGDFEVYRKADQSPVTAADHAAEAIILEHLARAAPDVPVVAEEEVAAGRIPVIAAEFFLVDPLDGTKEFVARRRDYTVNIALIDRGEPVLGVVFAPARNSLYAGDVLARQALHSEQDPERPLEDARQPIRVRAVPSRGLTVVSSRSHITPETDAYLAAYQVAERVSVGSSLKFCLVAAAQADLYPRLGQTMEWDTAAGHAVLVAAGGQVLAPGGQPLRYGKPGFRNSNFVATGTLVPRPVAA